MKRKVTQSVMVLVAGVAVVLVVMRSLTLTVERDAALGHVGVLQQRQGDLKAYAAGLEKKAEGLTRDLATQRESAAEALARYESERKTHEPLRQQIEKMVEAEIGYKDRLKQQDEQIAGLRSMQQNASRELEAMRADLDKATQANKAADAKYQDLVNSGANIRDELKQAKQQAGEYQARVADLESKRVGMEGDLAQAKRERDGLRAELDESQRKLAAAEADAKQKNDRLLELEKRLKPAEGTGANAP